LFLLGGGSALVVVVIALVVFLIIDPFAGTTTFTAAQLSAKWGPSTLYVQVSVNGTAVESGSGWVLNASEGLVVTNAHVVDGGNSFQVGQGPTQQPATLVGVSPCDDLAVLKIQNTTGLRSFVIGSQSTVQDGDTVTALGYPANSAATPNLSVTTGVVSVAETQLQQASLDTPQYPDLIQTSAAINPGNSGGPLLDDRGRVIGINSAGITEEGGRTIQGEGYAIGIDHAKAVLTQLAAGHSKGFAGFNFTFPTSAKDFSDLGLPVVQGGIIVASADPDSTAYNAGFGHDDPLVITAINGTALNGTLGSYCHLVGGLTTSQTAKFTVEEPSGRKLVVVLAFE
jgi:S1-C subfamily serine protease